MCWVLINHPYNIKEIHSGSARDKVITMCLVLVKIYGNNPKKLLNKIIENNEININVLPLKGELIKILNSKWRVLIILNQSILYREGITQNIDGININPKKVLIQFKERLNIVVDGSNTLNRFVIIFKENYFYYYYYYY